MPQTPSQIQYISFRYFLNETLLDRCRKNNLYSLRSFARDLGTSPSTLSRLLSGKRQIKRKFYEQCCLKLRVSPLQRSWFETFFEKQRSKKQQLAERRDYRTLSPKEAKLIGGWKCIAILSLLKVRGFQPSTDWISEKLGINLAEVNTLVSTMIRIGFITVTNDGQWNATHENVHFSPRHEVADLKKDLQKRMEMAIDAMDKVELGKKYMGTIIFPLANSDVRRAIDTLKELQPQYAENLDLGGPYDQVYCAGFTVFPLTRES